MKSGERGLDRFLAARGLSPMTDQSD